MDEPWGMGQLAQSGREAWLEKYGTDRPISSFILDGQNGVEQEIGIPIASTNGAVAPPPTNGEVDFVRLTEGQEALPKPVIKPKKKIGTVPVIGIAGIALYFLFR